MNKASQPSRGLDNKQNMQDKKCHENKIIFNEYCERRSTGCNEHTQRGDGVETYCRGSEKASLRNKIQTPFTQIKKLRFA